jgi:hypothetical protein
MNREKALARKIINIEKKRGRKTTKKLLDEFGDLMVNFGWMEALTRNYHIHHKP